MSKAKLLGSVYHPREKGNKQRAQWEKQIARQTIKRHDPTLVRIYGGADNGCLQAAVSAGIKRKTR